MPISDESLVITKYKSVIDALIPYQQSNKLLEGLNKLSARLPSNVRSIIKEEVIRLTALTDASADNSDFANFPVKRFKHFGIAMKLDRVGREILQKETAKYLDRYTVGVFESVMNSDFYQSQIKRAQQKKIVDAFSVQSQSYKDIDFGDDLAIRPNFNVSSIHFEKSKACSVSSLSSRNIVVESKRIPIEQSEDGIYKFVLPEVQGLAAKGTTINTRKVKSAFNQVSGKFETTFAISTDNNPRLIERLNSYVARSVNQLPLERDLEVERVLQDLDRDHILANSPWIPIFLERSAEAFKISKVLMTKVNFEFNHGFETVSHFPDEKGLNRIIRELLKFDETFLLKGTFKTKKGDVTVAATHRELSANGLLSPFIKMIMESQDFVVLQYRLCEIDPQQKNTAFDIHDINSNDYPQLDSLSHILFCKDISSWIGQLQVPENTQTKSFPSAIIDTGNNELVNVVMEAELDRRSEPRYIMNKRATIKAGMFKSYEAVLDDLSVSGLKLTLEPGNISSFEDIVKVSVPELKLRNEKYRIVHFNRETLVMRLAVPKGAANTKSVRNVMEGNSSYFKQRDITIQQRNIHRFLWDVSIRNLPCLCVLVTQNRHLISRLRTVYLDDKKTDLHPFSQRGTEVWLHGFLADKQAEKPKSTILYNLLSNAEQEAHVVHVLRHQDKRIIFVTEDDFLFGNVRQQLSAYVAKKQVETCITQVNAIKCSSTETPLTSKRLAQISKIDLDMYEKLKNVTSAYTHVLSITNVSGLHNALLKCGIKPVRISKAS